MNQDVTAHCFFGWCHHVETGPPDLCHAAMEEHYRKRHTADLDALQRRNLRR